jgi:glutathione S-transferase
VRLYDYDASGNCYKARLLLALLGTDYERVPIDIFAGDTLTEEYGRLNPVRETPVLELDDGAVITQSGAILWYLAEGTAFLPADRLGRAHVAQWLAFEQERVMGGIGGPRFRALTGRPPLPGKLEIGAAALALLDATLARRDWLVGNAPTIADIAVYAYAHVAPDAGLDLAPFGAFRAWTERIAALPGYMHDFVPYPENARAGAGPLDLRLTRASRLRADARPGRRPRRAPP